MHLRRDFQSQRIQPDEAGGVVLVVGLGRVGFHRGIHLFIQTAGANRVRHARRELFQFHFLGGDKR